MKMRMEVLAVETHGDHLQVTMQGKPRQRAANHWNWTKNIIQVPCTERSQRTYHVGRILTLEAIPQ